MRPLIRFTGLFLTVGLAIFTASGCSQPEAPLPISKLAWQPVPNPAFTKRVRVTVQAVPYGKKWSTATSYPVGATAKANVDVQWDGSGFNITADGHNLYRITDDLAFKNGQSANFKVTKEVSLNNPKSVGVKKMRISGTYTVKRGEKLTTL